MNRDPMHGTVEYMMVSDFYGTKRAKRSGLLLMNHINEGLYILNRIQAPLSAKRAFCIHPLIQSDADLENMWTEVIANCDKTAIFLAVEYRNIANQYLSYRKITDISEIQLSPLDAVNKMLYADKIQNYKDFLTHHNGKHPRSDELNLYFNNWLERLGIEDIFEGWNESLHAEFDSDTEYNRFISKSAV
jgi:hypothetical protein